MFRFRNLAVNCLLVLVTAISSTRAVAQATGSNVMLPAATIGTGYEVQISTDGMELAMPFTVEVSELTPASRQCRQGITGARPIPKG